VSKNNTGNCTRFARPATASNEKTWETPVFVPHRRASIDLHQTLHDDRGPPCHHCTTL